MSYHAQAEGLVNMVIYESDSNTNCNLRTCNDLQRLRKRIGKVGDRGKNKDYPDYSIVNIGKNTQKSPGDPERATDTQISIKMSLVNAGCKKWYNNESFSIN